ncbi:MAG: outer membrane lipoprotein carrier protein LolA [Deltaproteobacteria bacterium]|nr:outer membrane lipoprotein carrier protein LolA [Deltaproteobacteria bacterium]
MMKVFQTMVILLLILLGSSYAENIGDIKEKYYTIKTFKSQFAQTIFVANVSSTREFEGDFYYKKERGFLWLYKKPRMRYFLFDGKYLYQYDEEKPFILKEKLDENKSGNLFFDLIEDLGNLDMHFVVRERGVEKNYQVLNLEPKKEGMIKSVRIWFGKELKLDKIEILEKNGNRNLLTFRSVVLNGQIDDEKFEFKNEKRKEIIER